LWQTTSALEICKFKHENKPLLRLIVNLPLLKDILPVSEINVYNNRFALSLKQTFKQKLKQLARGSGPTLNRWQCATTTRQHVLTLTGVTTSECAGKAHG